MDQKQLGSVCFASLKLTSIKRGWDLSMADMLRTAMLKEPSPKIPPTVTTLEIYEALVPYFSNRAKEDDECVASFRGVSLEDLNRLIRKGKIG